MTEINKEKVKSFAKKLAKKEVSIRNEEGKGFEVPALVALVIGVMFIGPVVVCSLVAMALGFKFVIRDCADPCEEKEENKAE